MEKINLTEIECLKLQNLRLKFQANETKAAEANREQRRLLKEQEKIVAQLEEAHNIEGLMGWTLDLDAGTATPPQKAEDA